jgi:hypothetical protein
MKDEGLYRQTDSEVRLVVDHKPQVDGRGLRGMGVSNITQHLHVVVLLASYSPRPFRLWHSLVVDVARWRKMRKSTLAMK